MNRLLIVVMTSFICAISMNAQTQFTPFIDDGYTSWWGFAEKVTTELIECNSTSNVYKKINIHREYGVPRYGVIMDCNQNVDTVWYISNIYNRSTSGGINSPEFTDTSVTVWWEEGSFTVKIMDILTGNVVLDESHTGQHSSFFSDIIHSLDDYSSGTKTEIIEFVGGFCPKKDNNIGTTIYYRNLPNGLYWIYIVDENDIIWSMRTMRKGI